MRPLPFRLRAAINTYYALKYKNNGIFLTTADKEAALDGVFREARRYGFSSECVPGVWWFTRNGKTVRVSAPVKL